MVGHPPPPIAHVPPPLIQAPNVGGNQAPQGAQQGPIQFQLPKGKLSRMLDSIANAFKRLTGNGGVAPNTPHPQFSLSRTSLRGATTNDFQGVRSEVFGSVADRTHVPANLLNARLGTIPNRDARFDPNLRINLPNNEHLSGFSVSADPNSQVLDTTRPVVLFLSGSGGSAEKYGGHIANEHVTNHNCNFVALNYRGYGNSSALSPSESSITKDGLAMVNHLLNQGFNPDQIIIHGYSLGASVTSRLQATVESSGHQLRGVIYDRPMTSATGAAKAVAEEQNGSAFEVQKFAFGTKITVGAISTRKNLQDLVQSGGGLRSPTYLVGDTGSFGDRSMQLGPPPQNAQGNAGNFDNIIPHAVSSGQDHFDHTAALTSLATLPNVANLYV